MGKKWIKDSFGTYKPIIAMCHLDALPGDPRYDSELGMSRIVERARANMLALQGGGVDAIMFSNEFSLPYSTKVEPITTIAMARIIGELRNDLTVPLGVNVLWDPTATVELGVAVNADFAREVFSGVYASDFGLWDTNFGPVARTRSRLHGERIRLLFNIFPEASIYLGQRTIEDIAITTVFNHQPDVVCVSGKTAGAETSMDILTRVAGSIPEVPVFANTGVTTDNIAAILEITDGVVVGTAFKANGDFFDMVDEGRVREFMRSAREARGKP